MGNALLFVMSPVHISNVFSRCFNLEHKFSLKNTEFPTTLNQISRFEKQYLRPTNIFVIDESEQIFLLMYIGTKQMLIF